MKVGMFDSGVGGITVLKEALERLPGVEYIYYTDNLHVPYGTKSKEEVFGYVKEIVAFLIGEGAEAIVIACNTATSIAVQALRAEYNIPIIGMEPAVKLALNKEAEGKVLVTATELTLKEEKFKHLVNELNGESRVYTLALPELVMFAEAQMFEEAQLMMYFEEKLREFNLDEISGIVLGCTHFVYFKNVLKKILPPHITLYDGNVGTINHLKAVLHEEDGRVKSELQNKLSSDHIVFYYSGKKCDDHTLLDKYLKVATQ